ncbi:MAG: trypsin-like serine protease [Myxococcota bacterium]
MNNSTILNITSSLCLTLAVFSAACDTESQGRDSSVQDRIVGGVDTNIEEVPWQVSLQTPGGFPFCGGSIIDDEWILTAAHCIDGQSPSGVRVVAGITRQSDTNTQGQIRSVAQIIEFPGYQTPTQGKDIALLRLSSGLDLSGNRASAIEIATPADLGLTEAGTDALVSGWGTLSSGGSQPNTLQSVIVPIISDEDADAAYADVAITPDQIGAGFLGVGGRDSCQGDSGGPLVVNSPDGPLLAGVVSWGFGCADRRFPGMYARVTSFADWIFDNAELDAGPVEPPVEPPPVDSPLSCESNCGGQAPGGCWCDAQCTGFGDCCGDFANAC